MTSLSKFLRLPADEKRVVLFCVLALPVASLVSPLAGTYWARRSVAEPATSGEAPPWRVIERITHLVEAVAGRLWWRPSCLVRSVVLRYLLRARGIDTRLRIAVRLEGRQLHAHCWLECAGTPVHDAPRTGEAYRTFPGPASRR
jgi:hypothetical protein